MKTTFILTLFICALTFSAHAKRTMTLDEAFYYKQKVFSLQDPESDEALLTRTSAAGKNILLTLAGQENIEPETAQVYVDRGEKFTRTGPRIDGKKNPYNIKGFENMLLQIIVEERANGIEPSVGEFHTWAPGTRKNNLSNAYVKFEKLLIALALGVTYNIMPTLQEGALKEYLLKQNDKSVPFHDFLRRSYQLNNGNVYLTLLTMENILASNWKAPYRDTIPYFKKLIPMSSNYNEGGDIYGSYYHFIGIMLYGYVRGEIAARFVGLTEAMGSQVLSAFEEETQENLANQQGAVVGSKFRQLVEKNKADNFEVTKPLLMSDYLDHSEDFRDRLPQKLTDKLKVSVIKNSSIHEMVKVQLTNSGVDLKDCKIEIFIKNGKTFYETFRSNISSKNPLTVSAGAPGSELSARFFVSECSDEVLVAESASYTPKGPVKEPSRQNMNFETN